LVGVSKRFETASSRLIALLRRYSLVRMSMTGEKIFSLQEGYIV